MVWMLNRDQRRTALRLMSPLIVEELLEMRRFARRHGLAMRGLRDYQWFREARRFGLDLIPPMKPGGLVVDVGANEGQFAKALRRLSPQARVIAFEPEPATAARLRSVFESDPLVSVRETAVGASGGTASLHVTRNTVFASVLTPGARLPLEYSSGAESITTVDVEMTTLDDAIDGDVALLKIDVQGAEMDVLKGAARTLARTDIVLAELNFVRLYEGEAAFGAVHNLLGEAGFALHGFGKPLRSSTTDSLLWTDVAYARG
jgi:FkbM family methyltransferase